MAVTRAPCTCCGEHVDYPAGDSGDGEAPVPVTCSHGGFVHARCMWDRAETPGERVMLTRSLAPRAALSGR